MMNILCDILIGSATLLVVSLALWVAWQWAGWWTPAVVVAVWAIGYWVSSS